MEREKKQETYGTGSLTGGGYKAEDIFEGPEPWVPAETKLVVWSFVAATIALIVFGILVNIYILN